MLRFVLLILKLSTFALLVLVLGNWIHWGDRTVSDRVKDQISQAERSPAIRQARDWAGEISRDLRYSVKLDDIKANDTKVNDLNTKSDTSVVTKPARETNKELKREPARVSNEDSQPAANSRDHGDREDQDKLISVAEREKLRALLRKLDSEAKLDSEP